jgi:F-box and WD-40 domain protein 1/11
LSLSSVYCLEFDGTKIITGSRDKTIKIWDMRTGRLRGTLRGHMGSVLCLKFDKGECGGPSAADVMEGGDQCEGSGFMVSGSSDCTVLVWDLNKLWKSGKKEGGPEFVQRVLRGHTGGVLDLRIDKNWIVSWCVVCRLHEQRLYANCNSCLQLEGCAHPRVGSQNAGTFDDVTGP